MHPLQSCVYSENRTSIQCTTPSLAKLPLQPPVVTKVAFVLDGYLTDQKDLIYVEDPLFQDPKLTSKDNKSIVELKVKVLTLFFFFLFLNVSCPVVWHSELFSACRGQTRQIYFHEWSITAIYAPLDINVKHF